MSTETTATTAVNVTPQTPAPAAPEGQPATTSEPAAGATPANFDEWLLGQDEPIKALIEARFQTLENTVKATRSERDDFAKQIKTLAKGQAEGSEARKALDEISAKLETTERRAAFMEEAIRPDVQCKNPRAAWLLAQAEGHFTKSGAPDWNAIKAEAPELFGTATANANAGTGTGKPVPTAKNMNNFIRAAAGRG